MQRDVQSCVTQKHGVPVTFASTYKPQHLRLTEGANMNSSVCPVAWSALPSIRSCPVVVQDLLWLAVDIAEASRLCATAAQNGSSSSSRFAVRGPVSGHYPQQPCVDVKTDADAEQAFACLHSFFSQQLHAMAASNASGIAKTFFAAPQSSAAGSHGLPEAQASTIAAIIALHYCALPALQSAAQSWLQAALLPARVSTGTSAASGQTEMVAALQERLSVPALAAVWCRCLAEALNSCLTGAGAVLPELRERLAPLLRLTALTCTAAVDVANLPDDLLPDLLELAWPIVLDLLQHATEAPNNGQDDQANNKALHAQATPNSSEGTSSTVLEALRLLAAVWVAGKGADLLLDCKPAAEAPAEDALQFLRLLLAAPRALQMDDNMRTVRMTFLTAMLRDSAADGRERRVQEVAGMMHGLVCVHLDHNAALAAASCMPDRCLTSLTEDFAMHTNGVAWCKAMCCCRYGSTLLKLLPMNYPSLLQWMNIRCSEP